MSLIKPSWTPFLLLLISIAGCGLKQQTEPEPVTLHSDPALQSNPPLKPLESASTAASADKQAKFERDNAYADNRTTNTPSTIAKSRPVPAKPQSSGAANSANAQFEHKPKPMAKAKIAERESIAKFSISPMAAPPARFLPQTQWQERENYQHYNDNPVQLAKENPLSTFSIDVDTGSYTNTRRILKEGRLPVSDAVRAEEFINYFNYDYPSPDGEQAFTVTTEIGPSPWNQNASLLHIGIQGKRIKQHNLPPSNLVFLIDVSGSMQSADKLALLVKGLKMLTHQLRAQDRVAMVVYAGSSGLVLDSTSGDNKNKILLALDQLRAGGSTNGGSGIKLAYQTARAAYINHGSNRIILATDGDFNVGTVNFNALLDLVKQERKSGIELTTLGFGTGNYNDKLLEQLADAGNGNYAYIDSMMEAQKALVEQLGGTLHTIAKDVKIQIEFNPKVVREYRLIGYENRKLRREDFNNDKIDAGEIGAGHSGTALYEIVLNGSKGGLIVPLRYSDKGDSGGVEKVNELAFLKLRYKKPKSDVSELITTPLTVASIEHSLDKTSNNLRFSASVAAFAQILRGANYVSESDPSFDMQKIIALAQQAKGEDLNGYRSEYIRLLKLSQALMSPVANLRR